MAAHTADRWAWTAPILPLVVDAAVVIVVRLDSVLARLGGHGGRWPVVLRWMTGCMTLALNIADSALKKDLVGVAAHAVAPLLLIVTAETGLAYRRAITAAQSAHEARQKAEQQERRKPRRGSGRRPSSGSGKPASMPAAEAREQREHEARLARTNSAGPGKGKSGAAVSGRSGHCGTRPAPPPRPGLGAGRRRPVRGARSRTPAGTRRTPPAPAR
ncbi:hypothetical protein SMICM17S_08966 [Streptomyces microflavus]